MNKIKKYMFLLAIVLCFSFGVTVLAGSVSGNLNYNGSTIGTASLDNKGDFGTGVTHNNVHTTRNGFVSIFSYSKSGAVISSGTDTESICATRTIYAKNAKYYKSTHSIKKASDNRPLKTISLIAY